MRSFQQVRDNIIYYIRTYTVYKLYIKAYYFNGGILSYYIIYIFSYSYASYGGSH